MSDSRTLIREAGGPAMHTIRSMLMCGVASSVVAGCAIHPLPEDVTREATYSIVNKIRCEARDALTSVLIQQLRLDDSAHGYNSKILSEMVDRDVSEFVNAYNKNPGIVDKDSRDRIEIYRKSTIGYRFAFTITEDDDNVVNMKFHDPFFRGMFDLSLQGGDQRKRRNKREFSFVDNFEVLLGVRDLCDPSVVAVATAPNWVYPITGRVGLDEVIATFINLSYHQHIVFSGEKKGFVDTLTFTTIYYGSIAPKITLSPATEAFHLTESSADRFKATRTDEHELAVTIALAEKGESAAGTKQRAMDTLERSQLLGVERDILQRLDEAR